LENNIWVKLNDQNYLKFNPQGKSVFFEQGRHLYQLNQGKFFYEQKIAFLLSRKGLNIKLIDMNEKAEMLN
jgi:hypothetical protein